MGEAKDYDAIILGSGQAGNPLAAALAAAGRRTAMIERAALGGTCGNYGCTPTKTMVASAEVTHLARRAPEFGVHVGEVTVNMLEVRERKRRIVELWREGAERSLGNPHPVDVIYGEASFAAAKQLRIQLRGGGERIITADLIVINTGLRATIPSIEGLPGTPHLDNVSVMELAELPAHLLVLGGGYVGLEFAQMFARFGSRVTIVHRGTQLLSGEDGDVAEEIAKILREDGIEILLEANTTSVAPCSKGVRLQIGGKSPHLAIEGTHLLVASGRRPNTDRLNLDRAAIAMNDRGYITVNDKLETSVEGVYAVGDVNGGPAFTHVSYDDYRILKANLLDNGNLSTAGRLVPHCVFIDPQLGRVGLNENQARDQGLRVRIAKLPMSSVARAVETAQTRGFMKVLVDPQSEQILGAAILGTDGGELMSILQVAMMGKVKYRVLQNAILAHPTLAESLNNLFGGLSL